MTEVSVSDVDLGGIDPVVYRRRHLILGTMSLSLVVILSTVTSISVAIPRLAQSSLAPSDTQVLWIVDAYALAFAVFLLPAGAIGDRFGRKGALITGLAVFAVTSALCSRMSDANALIACRSAMGIGAALIMPATLSLLQSAFPPAERPKAIATWAGFAGAGASIGPLVGGVLVDRFWYGSVFLIPAPIALLTIVGAAIWAPRSREAGRSALDPVGALLSIVGFGGLLTAVIEGPELGWTHAVVLSGLVLCAVGLVGFVAHETRSSRPMLDMSYFRIPRFAAGAVGITVTFFASFAQCFVIILYLQYVRDHSPLESAICFLPAPLTMLVMSRRSADISAKFGMRRMVVTGLWIQVVGVGVMVAFTTGTPYVVVAASLVVSTLGVALTTPALGIGIMQSVPMNKAGVGSAFNDTTREVGGAVGIAVLGSIVTTVYRGRVRSALRVLPADLASVAHDNVGRAIEVARRSRGVIDDGAARQLERAVKQSFVDGAQVAMLFATASLAVAALVVRRQLGRDTA